MDPAALFLPRETLALRIADVMRRNGGRPGHIFNLGHGITPETDPAAARFLVDEVHRLGAKR